MVIDTKKALKAIHRLLHQGRRLASEGMTSHNAFAYFDELDGLMGYTIAWEEDKSALFEKELKRVCVKFDAIHVFDEFKRN